MKNTLLPKLSIMAIAIAALTGCPALTNFMALMSGKNQGPKKMLEVTGIPEEYNGGFMMVAASDPEDVLGSNSCGSIGGYNMIAGGKAKADVSEMSAFKTGNSALAMAATAKSLFGENKPCDGKPRIVSVVLFPSGGDMVAEDGSIKHAFIYTGPNKNLNICEPGVKAKDVPTYSFSDDESTLSFSDFTRASDCGALAGVLGLEGSEEYIVIDSTGLIVRDTISRDSVHNFATGEIIKVVFPKDTVKIGDTSWTKVYYKDEKGSTKKGWVIELFPTKTQGGSSSIETQDAISLAFTPTYNYTYGYSLPAYIGEGNPPKSDCRGSLATVTMVPYDSYKETYIVLKEDKKQYIPYRPYHYNNFNYSLDKCDIVSVYKNINAKVESNEDCYYYSKITSAIEKAKFGWVNGKYVDSKDFKKYSEEIRRAGECEIIELKADYGLIEFIKHFEGFSCTAEDPKNFLKAPCHGEPKGKDYGLLEGKSCYEDPKDGTATIGYGINLCNPKEEGCKDENGNLKNPDKCYTLGKPLFDSYINETINEGEAKDLLISVLKGELGETNFIGSLNKFMTDNIQLEQHEFNAILSVIFNLGTKYITYKNDDGTYWWESLQMRVENKDLSIQTNRYKFVKEWLDISLGTINGVYKRQPGLVKRRLGEIYMFMDNKKNAKDLTVEEIHKFLFGEYKEKDSTTKFECSNKNETCERKNWKILNLGRDKDDCCSLIDDNLINEELNKILTKYKISGI